MEHTEGEWEVTDYATHIRIGAVSTVDDGELDEHVCIIHNVSKANAHRIVNCVNGCKDIENPLAVGDLLKACKAQHEAIDILFAMLIERDKQFFPSRSGKPWEAVIQGNQAIAKAKDK